MKKEEYLFFEDPNKISHKKNYLRKRYIDHLKEIEEIGYYLLDFYELSKYKNIFDDIKNYHDIGKLLNIWKIENKEKPSHSFFSALYYNEIIKNKRDRNIVDYIILFFIYRHHSPLKFPELPSGREDNISKILKIPKFNKIKVQNIEYEYKEIINGFAKGLVEALNNLLTDYLKNNYENNFEAIINLIDTFGIFKLSDNISANFKNLDLNRRFSKIKIGKDRLTNLYFIVKKKRKDKEKLKEQLKIVKNSGNPSIVILPTGYGKTLIHLLYISKWKPSRVFYILPTITAIKKFYEELKFIFKDVGRKYYFVDTEDEYDNILEGNFLEKINIITIDQFLRTFLQLGKYYSRRFLFRKSLIIFDEFHLLNEIMLTLSLHFLRKFFNLYKLNIVFSSATLNKQILSEILNYFSPVWINGIKVENKNLGKVKEDILKFYSNNKRFKLEVIEKDITEDIQKIEEYSKKKKVLVIVNTISKAIDIYKNLNINNKILLHSRFTYIDRDFIEKNLYDKLSNDKPFVFISTQVSEVSLDVDFDILFTEASSIPSLIQRFGRVNRNGKKDDSIVFLYKPFDKDIQKLIYPDFEESFEFFKNNKNLSEKDWIDKYFEASLLDFNKVTETKKLINGFETTTNYFFSFTKKSERNGEDIFFKLVNFRESYSTYVLLDPSIIDEKTLKFWKILTGYNYSKLYNKYYNEKKKNISKILKRFLVPINVRNIKLIMEILEQEDKSYPRLSKEKIEEYRFKYNRKFGLRIEKRDIILDS